MPTTRSKRLKNSAVVTEPSEPSLVPSSSTVPTTRPTTRSTRSKTSAAQVVEPNGPASPSSIPSTKNKRNKTSAAATKPKVPVDPRWKNVRGKRGGLKNMINMPLEIIQEICLSLHPRDLLSLSRTTKDFHAFLLRKSSAWLWKNALKKIPEMPPCPEGLIEPAYVSLMYSPWCTNCCTRRATDIYWEVFAKICARCRGEAFTTKDGFRDIFGKDRYYKLYLNLSSAAFTSVTVPGFRTDCYLISQTMEVLNAWEKLHEKGAPDDGTARAFWQKWWAREHQMKQFALRCRQWENREADIRQTNRRIVLESRLTAIGSRLRALGWGPEADFLKEMDFDPLYDLKCIWDRKPLTDRIWQNMRDKVIERMDDVRAQRLETELSKNLVDRWPVLKNAASTLCARYLDRHPEMVLYGLDIGDLALQRQFREIMCAPTGEVVDNARFMALEDQMDVIVEEWRERVHEDLRGMWSRDGLIQPVGVDPLHLATTLFSGDITARRNFFPDVVACEWLRPRYQSEDAKGDIYETFVNANAPPRSYYVRNPLLRPIKPSRHVQDIIQLCGKDPMTTTAAEMDALDVRFVNLNGSVYSSWRDAVRTTTFDSEMNWRLTTEEETRKVKELEHTLMSSPSSFYDRDVWSCARCERPGPPAHRYVVQVHLRNEHGIGTMNMADDYKINTTLAARHIARRAFKKDEVYKSESQSPVAEAA